jgi:hypothetical protein
MQYAKAFLSPADEVPIERGKWNLTLRTITKVADGLGVEMWEIFRAADL